MQTTPTIEENVINATKQILTEELLPETVTKITSQIGDEITAVESRFEVAINQKTTAIENKFERAINHKITAVENRFEAVINQKNQQIDALETENAALKTRMQALERIVRLRG